MGIHRTNRLVWLILLFGCAAAVVSAAPRQKARPELRVPPPMEVSSQLANRDLLLEAQKLLPSGAYLGPLLDREYGVISHAWLEEQFIPYYRREVEKMIALGSRTADASDCDDYGNFLRHTLSLAGWVGHTAQPAAAHVIVFQENRFSGVGRTRERHSVCLLLTDRGWFVLEPQNAARLTPIDRYPNKATIQFITFH